MRSVDTGLGCTGKDIDFLGAEEVLSPAKGRLFFRSNNATTPQAWGVGAVVGGSHGSQQDAKVFCSWCLQLDVSENP